MGSRRLPNEANLIAKRPQLKDVGHEPPVTRRSPYVRNNCASAGKGLATRTHQLNVPEHNASGNPACTTGASLALQRAGTVDDHLSELMKGLHNDNATSRHATTLRHRYQATLPGNEVSSASPLLPWQRCTLNVILIAVGLSCTTCENKRLQKHLRPRLNLCFTSSGRAANANKVVVEPAYRSRIYREAQSTPLGATVSSVGQTDICSASSSK